MITIENISPNPQLLSGNVWLPPGNEALISALGAAETAGINRGYLRIVNEVVMLGASPAVLTADFTGLFSIVSGTVSLVEFSLDDGATWNVFAHQTTEDVPVSSGDQLRITYSAAPTVTKIPRRS